MSDALQVLVAIDALDDLLHNAKAVPLTDQVRLEPDTLEARLAVLRAHWPASAGPALLEELEAVVAGARPIPLTAFVRVDREPVYAVLDRMRAELPEALARERPAAGRTALHHVALEVRRDDVPACERFWALLGFARVEPPVTLRDRAVWVERDGTQIHLMHADDPVAMPSGHVAVVARDYHATLAALRDAGFAPEPRAEHWGSPRAFVRCPAGHRVEVMAFPPGGSVG